MNLLNLYRRHHTIQMMILPPHPALTGIVDHYGHLQSICQHVDSDQAEGMTFHTNAAVVSQPSQVHMYVFLGPPCQNAFQMVAV